MHRLRINGDCDFMENTEVKEFSFKDLYTPLSEAKKEILKRWNDKELKKKVDDYLKEMPSPFSAGPGLFIARHVASPNNELLYFMDLVKQTGMDSCCLEYLNDKFVAGNSDKYHLCKMFFYNGFGKNGGERISSKKTVDIDKYQGKKFNELETIWNENFIGFHHRILSESGIKGLNLFDISDWYKKHGGIPSEYYKYYFALFIRGGILFENYLFNDDEKDFTKNIVIPNLLEVTKYFGLKPLIVPLVPRETENDLYWWYYPEKVKNIF